MRSLGKYSLACRQGGLSIIELMVSILIAAMVLAGVVQLYATSSQNAITFEGGARIQENARFVFSRLESDLTQAGSGGCFSITSARDEGRFTSLLGLRADNREEYDMSRALGGIEGGGVRDSDSLFIRYANKMNRIPVISYGGDANTTMTVDNTDPNYVDLAQNQVVYAGSCTWLASFMITNDPATSVGVINYEANTASTTINEGQFNTAQDGGLALGPKFGTAGANSYVDGDSLSYIYVGGSAVHEYTLGDSAAGACTDDDPQNCALFRDGLELAQGVDRFGVEYGWENNAGSLFFGDWDAVIAAAADDRISQIKVTVSINSIDRTPTADGEEYLSREFSRIFMVRNRLMNN